jgi:glutathione S-transferase
MALSKSEIKIELREISLKNRPDSLYTISPKGTVPVLQISNTEIIDESLQIMLWAIEKSNLDWLEKNPKKQIDMIKINDADFKYWLNRYKYSDRYPEKSINFYKDNCTIILSTYEEILNQEKYLFDSKYQLADIAIFPLIRQCENVDPSWFADNFPNLSRWLNQIKLSNVFLSVMNKYELWDEEKSGLIIRF